MAEPGSEPGPLVPLCLEYHVDWASFRPGAGAGPGAGGRVHCWVSGADTSVGRAGATATPGNSQSLGSHAVSRRPGPRAGCVQAWWGRRPASAPEAGKALRSAAPARSRAGRSGPTLSTFEVHAPQGTLRARLCKHHLLSLRGGASFPRRLPARWRVPSDCAGRARMGTPLEPRGRKPCGQEHGARSRLHNWVAGDFGHVIPPRAPTFPRPHGKRGAAG